MNAMLNIAATFGAGGALDYFVRERIYGTDGGVLQLGDGGKVEFPNGPLADSRACALINEGKLP